MSAFCKFANIQPRAVVYVSCPGDVFDCTTICAHVYEFAHMRDPTIAVTDRPRVHVKTYFTSTRAGGVEWRPWRRSARATSREFHWPLAWLHRMQSARGLHRRPFRD